MTQLLRAISGVRAVYGLALLAVPAATARALGAGALPDRASVAVARVLAARHLAQAAITLAKPCRTTAALGLVADTAHAASMVYVARHAQPWRRPAARSAAVAGTFAVGGALAVALAVRT